MILIFSLKIYLKEEDERLGVWKLKETEKYKKRF